MIRKALTILFTFCLGVEIGCKPPGVPQRDIQPPFQLAKPTGKDQKPERIWLQPGLPDSCQMFNSKKREKCIACNTSPRVTRCLSVRNLQPQKHCKFTEKKLKCLSGKKVININLEKPKEKIFKKQLGMLVENIRGISSGKVSSPKGKETLNQILSFLIHNLDKISEMDDQESISQLSSILVATTGATQTGHFNSTFEQLQRSKIKGKLSLNSPRDFLVQVLQPFPELKEVETILANLNLQGLEPEP